MGFWKKFFCKSIGYLDPQLMWCVPRWRILVLKIQTHCHQVDSLIRDSNQRLQDERVSEHIECATTTAGETGLVGRCLSWRDSACLWSKSTCSKFVSETSIVCYVNVAFGKNKLSFSSLKWHAVIIESVLNENKVVLYRQDHCNAYNMISRNNMFLHVSLHMMETLEPGRSSLTVSGFVSSFIYCKMLMVRCTDVGRGDDTKLHV